jgi:Crinkler effector protein N-terminal domain
VDIPADERLNDIVGDISIGQPLHGVNRLKARFPGDLNMGNVHILIGSPSHSAHHRHPVLISLLLASPRNLVHVATPAPGALITLNCWVLSDDPDRVFPVDIDSKKSVGALKDEIKTKKKRRLGDIDADDLDLWRVSERIAHSLALTHPIGLDISAGSSCCAGRSPRS